MRPLRPGEERILSAVRRCKMVRRRRYCRPHRCRCAQGGQQGDQHCNFHHFTLQKPRVSYGTPLSRMVRPRSRSCRIMLSNPSGSTSFVGCDPGPLCSILFYFFIFFACKQTFRAGVQGPCLRRPSQPGFVLGRVLINAVGALSAFGGIADIVI
jgi:hypothetical protein